MKTITSKCLSYVRCHHCCSCFPSFLGYKAMALLSSSHDVLPQIYFVTDGSVDDERNICHTLKTQLIKSGSKSPRISTFGLGNILYHNWLCIAPLIQLLLKNHIKLNHVGKFSVVF